MRFMLTLRYNDSVGVYFIDLISGILLNLRCRVSTTLKLTSCCAFQFIYHALALTTWYTPSFIYMRRALGGLQVYVVQTSTCYGEHVFQRAIRNFVDREELASLLGIFAK